LEVGATRPAALAALRHRAFHQPAHSLAAQEAALPQPRPAMPVAARLALTVLALLVAARILLAVPVTRD